jgi:signal transduction histidine kinase/ActR/RegA family two-component response regulator
MEGVMSRSCEFCGGEIHELARTRNHVWISCHHCQRSWREDLDANSWASVEAGPPMPVKARFPESTLGQYVTAAAAVALAFSVRLALKPLIGNASPFLLFTPAVMAAAWYGGVGPAIMATGAGAVLGNHFFLRTIGEPGLEQWDRVALFLLVGGLLISLTTVLRASRRRLADSLWREQKARAEAEAANQTKDDFISLISHELQTPVSVVQGWATSIRKRQLHGEALSVALDAIERNAQVQSRLVQDLLDRSRIVSGRMRLEPKIVSISEILRAAVEQMRPNFDHNHQHVTTAISDTEYPMSADPVRLQQVFTNLLSNAAKFTPPGGHIAVEASCTASTAVVTIKDDGVGISAEFLPHLFDGFQQDPRAQVSSLRGLGLGLSIARHFVERHGGMLRATSEGPGRGATFTVLLPLQPRQAAVDDRRPKDVAPGALRSISVLLVEDDEDARTLLTDTLEYYGAHVLPVASASEAAKIVEQHQADVLLSDLRLPGEDGFALIHNLRSRRDDPQIASIPAASITASRLTEDRHHAIAAGYQLHLQKPVDPDELISAILSLADMPRHGYGTH